jgi:group II intron reverse transcriptase/maturase
MSRSRIQLTEELEIAKLARHAQDMKMTSLNRHLTQGWMEEAYRRTRKDGAVGVDGKTAWDFEQDLAANLTELLNQAKSGRYHAPPVRRTFIPKGTSGELRGLGIPTFSDKVLQRAVLMIFEAVYEQDFLPCSFGFRPERSALMASDEVHNTIFRWGECYVIDVDVRKYFDSIPHQILHDMIKLRITDGVLNRLIGKWLKAGVYEDGIRKIHETGSPQGAVISPCLANVYLHHVLDTWFEDVVVKHCNASVKLVRYADDFVIIVKSALDAQRIFSVLGKRFAKFGLQLHEEKTRVVHFGPQSGGSFDFLGFTHHWGKSRKGQRIPKRKTAKDRLVRIAKKLKDRCKRLRHSPIAEQVKKINCLLQGLYNYYGVTHNIRSLHGIRRIAGRHWFQSLRQRAQRRTLTWEEFNAIVENFPLAPPKIVHSILRTG